MPSFSTTTFLSALLATSALATNSPLQPQARDSSNCPGVTFNRNGLSGCCVGGTIDSPYLSVCKGWPICEGPTTTTWTATPISCATIVTDGASYDAAISSARASLQASGTHLVTALDGVTAAAAGSTAEGSTATASPGSGTGAGATATGSSGAAATSEGTAGADTGSASGSSTTTTSGAAEMVARWGVAGGAIMAFVAALL